MSRPLLALNLFMAALSVVFFVRVVYILFAPDSRPLSRTTGAFAGTAPHPRAVAVPISPLRGGYDVITTQTLFHPNRSAPKSSDAITQTLPLATELTLYGVVISQDTRLAYLEDPATKRIVGYKTGDKLAGGRVQRIEPDRVVIMRAEGAIEVKLHDPNKSRPVVSESPPAEGTSGRFRRQGHDS